MRQLFINSELTDIEENAAIGITYQSGDLSEPVMNKLSITNTFSLPYSSANKKIFKFLDSPFNSDSVAYDKMTVKYYDGNILLLDDSKCFVISTNGKYNLSVIKGGTVLDALKFNQLAGIFTQDGLAETITNTPSGFFYDISEGAIFNLFLNPGVSEFLGITTMAERIIGSGAPDVYYQNKGAFGIKVKTLFDWINLYGLNYTQSDKVYYQFSFNGTAAQITDFENLVIPFPLITIEENAGTYGFLYSNDASKFDTLGWHGEKTLFDVVKSLAIIFNGILDIDETNKTVKITTFNKIIYDDTVIDWTSKFIKVNNKKFEIGKWVQQNIINYDYDDGVQTTGAGRALIECNNKNIEVTKEYKNGLFVHRSMDINSDSFYLLGSTDVKVNLEFTQKGIAPLFFYYITGSTSSDYGYVGSGGSKFTLLQISGYNFSPNYSDFRTILTDPVFFEADLNINILDMYTFTPATLVKIDQLGGVFYVNKINGFNSKSKSGTKIELIKIR